MTDDLTRAVKKLRGIQQDVERLKAARDEAGEVRFLRQTLDRCETDDSVDVDPDATVDDTTEAADSVATGPDAVVSDDISASDTTATTVGAVEQAVWGSAAWNEDYWN